jgi:hypothetical protein
MKSCSLIFACLCGVGVAMAADPMPHHKAGLWEIAMSLGSDSRQGNEKVCMDASTEQLMLKAGAGASQKMCSKTDIHSSNSQITVDSVCKIGNSTTTGHSVTTFTGDTAYHTEVMTHFDPPLANRADSKATMDGKWMGACPADMKPGDLLMTAPGLAQPMRMNLKDMLGQ